jgi:hypothetical protein
VCQSATNASLYPAGTMRKTTSSSSASGQTQSQSTGGPQQQPQPHNLSATLPNNMSASSAINVDFTVTESTSKFYATFGTATSLLKMIVPLIRCVMFPNKKEFMLFLFDKLYYYKSKLRSAHLMCILKVLFNLSLN